ncbi:hypothetical protein H0H87_000448 [Tephrocybe sp. NHM501043]|nr:hypothetical protein H0H87_000448 [Tephrocybe sp. NHM501043]
MKLYLSGLPLNAAYTNEDGQTLYKVETDTWALTPTSIITCVVPNDISEEDDTAIVSMQDKFEYLGHVKCGMIAPSVLHFGGQQYEAKKLFRKEEWGLNGQPWFLEDTNISIMKLYLSGSPLNAAYTNEDGQTLYKVETDTWALTPTSTITRVVPNDVPRGEEDDTAIVSMQDKFEYLGHVKRGVIAPSVLHFGGQQYEAKKFFRKGEWGLNGQ